MKSSLLIGTGGDQIYRATLSLESGLLSLDAKRPTISTGKGPTWLIASKDKKKLVIVNEESDKIQIFDRHYNDDDNKESPSWTKSSEFSSGGATPCYLQFVPGSEEKSFVCANYNENVTVLETASSDNNNNNKPISFVGGCSKKVEDASIEEPIGPQTDRQAKSHPHMATFEPHHGGKFLLVPDLGTDTIAIFRREVNANNNNSATFKLVNKIRTSKPGLGPRHLIFHPKREIQIFYLVNELASSISVFEYKISTRQNGNGEPEEETLFSAQEVETVSCLPPGKSSFDYGGSSFDKNRNSDETTPSSFGVAQNTCASLNIEPRNNKFLYVSCRGRDVITGFQLDEKTGRVIKRIGEVPSLGRTPRFFCFSECGGFVIVLNQETDSVVVFRFNQETGEFLMPPTSVLSGVKSPQCVAFV